MKGVEAGTHWHGNHFLLDQEPQLYQPGVGSWKEALSQDNGLKCPVGLLVHWPFSLGHIVATMCTDASGFQISFLPVLALQPLPSTASISGLMEQSPQVMDLDLLGFLGPGLDLVPALRGSQYPRCFLSPRKSNRSPLRPRRLRSSGRTQLHLWGQGTILTRRSGPL